MPESRNSGLLALGGIALAALLAVVGHLGVDGLDPWSLTISDYAVSDRGGAIDTAMMVLAVATAVLLPALRRLWRARPVEMLLAAWIGGLLLAAAVPTNEPGLPMDTAAYVHRYASVIAFLALPLGGWLLADRLPAGPARWVRRFAVASLVLAAAMIWSAYPGDRMLLGLVERLLIVAEVAILATVAVALTAVTPVRAASAAGPPR